VNAKKNAEKKRCSALLAAAFLASGCAAPAARVELATPSLAAWRSALSELAALREAATGNHARTLKLSLALREPFTGRRTEARGAVAISPADRALRMILLGPGGTTAFDLWIREDAFRMSIPAIDLLRRGTAATPRAEMRGLPVDFLRWWMLDPTHGELLWSDRDADGTRYVLRDGGAITSLRVHPNGSLSAERRTWAPDPGAPIAASPAPASPESASPAPATPDVKLVLIDEEKVSADRVGCGHARYTQASTGVEIEIACEAVEPNPPSERAFRDPDAVDKEDDP